MNTEIVNFSSTLTNFVKQGEMHHCLWGVDAPETESYKITSYGNITKKENLTCCG